MEHRYGKRVDVQLDVQLYSQGIPVAAGKTRNVARGGVFIETNYKPENGKRCFDIVFISDDVIKTGANRLKGLIVYRKPEGFGLVIDDSDPESRLTTQMINTRRSELEGDATNAERTQTARYEGAFDT
jgi:hypothetical protein